MVAMRAQEADLTTFAGSGEISADELLNAYKEFIAASPTRLVLLDMTEAKLARISTPDVRRLARTIAEMGARQRPPGKSAILCNHMADFGVARMFQIYLSVEGYPARLASFMDEARAREWLKDTADQT